MCWWGGHEGTTHRMVAPHSPTQQPGTCTLTPLRTNGKVPHNLAPQSHSVEPATWQLPCVRSSSNSTAQLYLQIFTHTHIHMWFQFSEGGRAVPPVLSPRASTCFHRPRVSVHQAQGWPPRLCLVSLPCTSLHTDPWVCVSIRRIPRGSIAKMWGGSRVSVEITCI